MTADSVVATEIYRGSLSEAAINGVFHNHISDAANPLFCGKFAVLVSNPLHF